MPCSTWRWVVFDESVNKFNKYWASHYVPPYLIYVSKSRCTSGTTLGVHCINMGLPMYAAIDHNPVNGREIQNSCDARSQVMIQLKLVKFGD